ncbi:MAG: Clp protease N-terminal domain-containing protein [Phycisphaerae bacterium]
MHESLTPRMDRIIKLAQQIARDYDRDYVGTEHLLLAILKEGTGAGSAILRKHGIDFAKARSVVDKYVRASLEETWVFGRLPGTPHFRDVMKTAIEEARQLESRSVCAEHLLIALARAEGSVAHAALGEMGIKAPTIRAAINHHLENGERGE